MRPITRCAMLLLAGMSTLAAAQDAPPAVATAPTPGLAVAPEGWAYLPELAIYGPADIYHIVARKPGEGGPRRQMLVQTKKNVGILTRDVDVPLSAATQLSWRWKVDQIPSKLPETVPAQHDYFSIAVKFENGKDLTYMWSSSLEEGLGFDCPLPGWTGREYHVVIRSGSRDLGKWLSERRNVAADYARYVGPEAPGRIVQVWFIANTIIQQGEASARFGEIVLTPGAAGKPLKVF
ncbi:DUF3047 domain-containing protein [Sandarakinorhabdus rubra]|uniref:DUF3047 domain-containing protein n=1 Tax=Sandarakinorhabdus rubra TaxID=2672568 RepID=UPI0013D9CB95|nr:DUF3047 domain-containing protein [Sandarakinorhabdus rubra]